MSNPTNVMFGSVELWLSWGFDKLLRILFEISNTQCLDDIVYNFVYYCVIVVLLPEQETYNKCQYDLFKQSNIR